MSVSEKDSANKREGLQSKADIKVCFVPQWPTNPYHSQLQKHLRGYGVEVQDERPLKQIFRKAKRGEFLPNVVHLHAVPLFSFKPVNLGRLLMFWFRVRTLKKMGVRIVWTVHDITHHEAIYPRIELTISRVFFNLADGVMVHSPAAQRKVESDWNLKIGNKISIIPHGNYNDCYPNEVNRFAAREKLKLPRGSLVFLFLGNIRPYKGVMQLIHTFKELSDKSVQLVIAGKPCSEKITSDIQTASEDCSRIHLYLDFVPDNQIQLFMNASDVVIFPYTKTLTSGALILAMTFGRACIAPKMGALEDTLDDTEALLYDPLNPNGLRESLEFAVQNQDRLDEIGKRNRRCAGMLSWDDAARLTAEIYYNSGRTSPVL